MSFTFKPHKYKAKADGTHEINPETSSPYIMLSSHTQGTVYYSYRDNKYYVSEDKEYPKAKFEKEILPYLRWEFDNINEKGVNLNPPSSANIAEKRKELITAANESGKMISQEQLFKQTAPIQLLNNAEFERRINEKTPDEKMIQRIKASGV